MGVLPASFNFPRGTEIWFPDNPAANPSHTRRAQFNNLAIGRLKSGVTPEQAQTEMSTIAARLEQQYPESNTGRRVLVTRLQDYMVGDVRQTLYLLLAAVGLVLLIACANMATLLLARATTRTREVAVRTALGASRGRLARQMLTEGVMLGLLAGAVGLVIAIGGTRALVTLAPGDVPRLSDVRLDGTVLAFTFAVSVVSSLLLAMVPALQASHVDVEHSLKPGVTRTDSGGRSGRFRELLVTAQIALAVMLLAMGGLLIRSVMALQNVPLGFRPESVLVTQATIANPDPRAGGTLFFQALLDSVSHLPGVVAAGATMAPPGQISASSSYWRDHLPNDWMNSGLQRTPTVMSIVSPSTFTALGIPMVNGRDFRDSDTPDAPRVAIVNEALARDALPGQDIVGHTIFCLFDSSDPMTVVGVVADARQAGPANPPQPECYMPYLQHAYNGATLSLVIRTAVEPTSLAESVRRKVQEISPAVPVKFTTLETLTSQHTAAPRFRALLVSLFAAVALVLTLVGVFGVMAYVVGQRTAEIGLRVALGASPSQVLWLLFARGLALTGAGVTLGLAGSIAAARIFGSLLFEIKATDPVTYVGVAGLLALTSLVASYVPARRATGVDPLIALRSE